MKIFRFLVVALVAMVGLNSCSDEQNFIEVDHSADLVGTWTCFTEDYAEALVINADGSVVSTGVEDGEYWENVAGNVKVVNNKMTLTFEDNDNYEGRFEMLAGEAFTIFDENGESLTYRYCETDLSDEIVGMWVCMQEAFGQEEEMVIQIFDENGICTFTGYVPDVNGYIKEAKCNYKVIGNLLITTVVDNNSAPVSSVAIKIDITPNAIEYGDIMSTYNPVLKTNSSFLRIKQHLDLANKSYDYSNIYVTNVKAMDAEFEFAGQTLNLATMDGRILDKMMKTLLFNVSFPSSDEIVYNYYYNGQNVPMPSPIVVDGNKMTIKKSANNPAYKDIDVWTFQDQDNTQMHMYMPTYAFENFIANTAVELMAQEGKLDLSDAEAVAAIYDGVANAIETINVSFIFKDSTRAL